MKRKSAVFWTILVLTTAWRVVVSAKLNLCYDEGYYHYWSLFPQLSYLDHPPFMAWAMYVSGLIFGDSVWTVRIWPILTGTALVLIGRAMTRAIFDSDAGDRAGIFLALTPVFAGNGVLMTPDAFFALFWAAALYSTWKALGKLSRFSAWWLAAGLCAGLGLLSKYNMVLFFLGLGVLWLVSPARRKAIFAGGVTCGIMAVVIFLPVIIWNAENHWASFALQLRHGFSGKPSSILSHFGAYVGSLLLLATPLLGLLALSSSFTAIRAKEFGRRFCAAFCIVIVGFFAFSALKARVETNWPMLAFFSGMALLANDWPAYSLRLRRAAVLLLAFCWVIIGIYPLLPSQFPLRVAGHSLDVKRMEEFIGGREFAASVRAAKEETGADLVYVPSHQLLGRLSFYAPDLRPFLCPSYTGRLRYPWIDCGQWAGKKALIVSDAESDPRLQFSFHAVTPLKTVVIPYKKYLREKFYLFVGEGYSPQ